MASNPFFSGRIPQSLFDAVEEYRQSSNVSKTDVLIKALSAYVNLPLKARSTQVEGGNSRIESLENRVANLEKLLTAQQSKIPEADGQMSIDDIQPDNNIDNKSDSSTLVVNNRFDNATENNGDEIIITADNKGDNNLKVPDGIFIGNMRTVEVANLPGLEDKDSTKIGTKLFRAAKRESKVETINQYTCVYTGRSDKRGKTGKFEMLWDIYRQASPSLLREEVE
jgi:hypothetical protein